MAFFEKISVPKKSDLIKVNSKWKDSNTKIKHALIDKLFVLICNEQIIHVISYYLFWRIVLPLRQSNTLYELAFLEGILEKAEVVTSIICQVSMIHFSMLIDGPHVYTYIISLFSVSFTRIQRCFTRPTKCCKGLYYGGLYVRVGRSQPRRQGPALRNRLHYWTCVPRPRIPIWHDGGWHEHCPNEFLSWRS